MVEQYIANGGDCFPHIFTPLSHYLFPHHPHPKVHKQINKVINQHNHQYEHLTKKHISKKNLTSSSSSSLTPDSDLS